MSKTILVFVVIDKKETVLTYHFSICSVVSAVYAMATWLAGCLSVCLSVTAGIVSKRPNLS